MDSGGKHTGSSGGWGLFVELSMLLSVCFLKINYYGMLSYFGAVFSGRKGCRTFSMFHSVEVGVFRNL